MDGRIELRFLGRHPLLIPLVISLLVGVIYAAMLPPWDLIDEEQHVHYVQYLVERRQLPEMGKTYLSPEIVTSLFEVDRWQRLGLPHPPGRDPRDWGLEGLSYEAYQPPLFYLAFAVPYALLPDSMLVKLYGLRALVVLIGSLSVVGCFVLARIILPEDKVLAVAAASLMALIPERAMAIGRFNNDSLAELLSVLVLLLLALSLKRGLRAANETVAGPETESSPRSVARGLVPRPCPVGLTRRTALRTGDVAIGTLSWKYSALIGIAAGLALLSKLSAVSVAAAVLVIWLAAYRQRVFHSWLAQGCIIGLSAAVVSGWLFYRNLVAYGDMTGTSSFLRFVKFSPDYSLLGLLGELARGFWGIWWWNRPLYVFGLLAAALFCLAVVALALSMRQGSIQKSQAVALLALGAMLVVALAGVAIGTAAGWVPLAQGRLMLPAYAPAVIITVLGLYKAVPPRARVALVGTVLVAVLALNAYVLLYLIPYRYPGP